MQFQSLNIIGESPSGKAGAFEAPIPWFESMLPSHPSSLLRELRREWLIYK